MVDSSDHDRLDESREELERALQEDSMSGIPFVILANKQDLSNAMSPAQLIDPMELDKYIGRHLWHVQATCMVTGEGLQEAMETIAKFLKRKGVWLWIETAKWG